jgi:GNAT superfamily N-acetyltransferase
MNPLTIRTLTTEDRTLVRRVIEERWGAPFIVIHSEVLYPHEYEGFLAVDANGDAVGLLTLRKDETGWEVLSLDSLRENQGIGSALLETLRQAALQAGCRRLWLITTNDNLHALRFYQGRGYRLVAVHRGAVDQARKLKPQIPLISEDGIPIRDELELELLLRP